MCIRDRSKGFMLRPGSRVANMCVDVIPISAYLKETQPQTKPKKKFGLF